MLHIFLVKTEPNTLVPTEKNLVFGESITAHVEREIADFYHIYCADTTAEAYTLAVINEDYQFDEATAAARELFCSKAIAEDGDVLMVWDDVLAIDADFLVRLITEHRMADNVSTFAYEPDNELAWFAPLAFAAKGQNFKAGLLKAEKQGASYFRGELILSYCPITKFEFTENYLHANSPKRFAAQLKLLQSRIVRRHAENGVLFADPDSVCVAPQAQIGRNTLINSDVTIEGDTVIGENCIIGPHAKLVNMRVGDNAEVEFQCLYNSEIEALS